MQAVACEACYEKTPAQLRMEALRQRIRVKCEAAAAAADSVFSDGG